MPSSKKIGIAIASGESKPAPPVTAKSGLAHRFCVGVLADVQRRRPYWVSDWVDAFKPENVQLTFASIYFLFFICLTPALGFGTLLADATDNQIGVVETILATALMGVIYAVISGQPLCIQGATGPDLAYTIVFYKLCKSFDIEFLPARVWQGLWCGLFTVLLAITDCCDLMSHFTRFVEDIFSALISVIFFISAGISVIHVYNERDHAAAFLTTLLCLGTFFVTMWLKSLKGTVVANKLIRRTLANFSAPLAILAFTLIAQLWKGKVNIEWMEAPPERFRPTWDNPETGEPRSWFINPFGINKDFPTWAIFATILPALGMSVLGCLDQNLTTLVLERPSNGLRKPSGSHLDLFVCGAVIYPLCCILGLPYTHNATAPSMIHLMSLTHYQDYMIVGGSGSFSRMPSSRRISLGVVEQRFSNFAIHALIGLSLPLAPLLKYMPKAVTLGIFLVMGVTSMVGNQLFERMSLWLIFDPRAYPKYNFVTRVPHWKVHLFTFIQVVCLVGLFAMKEVQPVAAIFPFFLGGLVFVHKALPLVFTEAEMKELDSREEMPLDLDKADPTVTTTSTAALQMLAKEAGPFDKMASPACSISMTAPGAQTPQDDGSDSDELEVVTHV